MAISPDFNIIVDGNQDVSAAFKRHLMRIELVDQEGIEADTFNITLADDGTIAMPREGVALTVSIGYVGQLVEMGIFTVDTVELSPNIMRITAHAVDMQQAMKSQKTRAWENVTVHNMVSTIASAYGLQTVVHADMQNVTIPRADQVSESDVAFLTRIARQLGAVFKVFDKTAIMMPVWLPIQNTTASGATVTAITLHKKNLLDYTIKTAGRAKYNGAKAIWHSVPLAKSSTESMGTDPFEVHPRTFSDKQQAVQAVKSMLIKQKKDTASAKISVMGSALIMYGTHIELAVKTLPTSWMVKKAQHIITQSGYETIAELNVRQ